jgi:hypothetical protein
MNTEAESFPLVPPDHKGLVYHPELPFSDGDGEDQFRVALSTGTQFGVLDLETAPAAGLPAFNDFFIETRHAALVPAAGEILLSGVRTPDPQHPTPLIQYYKGGEQRIVEKTVEACSQFVKGGILIGHNIAGFDLPFLAVRCAALGLPVPSWAISADRTIDTLRLFGWGKFRTGMLSLQDTAALWGREPDLHSGASFGELWRAGTSSQRDSLRHYNMLNLVDTVCLALHSGKLGMPEGVSLHAPSANQEVWQPSEGYEFGLETVPPPPATPQPPVFFQWLTTPLPGLLEHGPFKKAGWGRTSSPESRLDYPAGTGRLDASSSRVVGFVSSRTKTIDLESEASAISSGLLELAGLIESHSKVLTESPSYSKSFICLRASVHGGILPPWLSTERALVDDRPASLGGEFLQAIAASAGIADARIPPYGGAVISDYLESAWRIAAHRAVWGSLFQGI